jgi:hypothetical protein
VGGRVWGLAADDGDIGGRTSWCHRRDALSRVFYGLGARYPVIVVDFGSWNCGLAFGFWESAGREGEAVRGLARGDFLGGRE